VTLGDGFNYVYKGQPFGFSLPCGHYEMFIKLSNGMSYWSEVFQIVEFPIHQMPYLAFTWYNNHDLEKIVYSNGFVNRVYFNSFIAHSEPKFTEVVKADGLGVEIPVSAVSTDVFIFSEVVPDYMKNALAAAPICTEILVDDPKTEVSFKASRLKTNQPVEEGGCQSFVELQFEVDNDMYRTGCQ
jgi:hypothetical protein